MGKDHPPKPPGTEGAGRFLNRRHFRGLTLKQAAHMQRPATYLFGARPRGVSVLIRGPGCTQWAPRICPPVRAEPFVPRAQQTPAAQLHAPHQLRVPCFPRPSSALGRPGLPARTLLCGVDLPQSPDLGPPLLG